MAHSHHEHEQQYHRRGCIICELIHRLFTLEGDVDAMSQAWEEQESRFARDVSELKSKFETLNAKVTELTGQVDSAEATQAAEFAADFKSSLDQFEAAFGIGSSDSGSGAPVDPPAVDSGPDAGGTPAEPPAEPPVEVTEPPADGPHVDNSLPQEPETPPEPQVPEPPVDSAPDPNDPNAAPEPSQESPASDPTIPVPGSE